ncbi:MAG: tail fiber domain-containing protein [Bacteroidota bacterium]
MKTIQHLLLLICLLLIGHSSLAQWTNLNFQGVLRDPAGALLANGSFDVKFTFRGGNSSGNIAFEEEHFGLTTDAYGHFTAVIGDGTPLVNTIDNLQGHITGAIYYFEISVDLGSGYVLVGGDVVRNVPKAQYALSSTKTRSLVNGVEDSFIGSSGSKAFTYYHDGKSLLRFGYASLTDGIGRLEYPNGSNHSVLIGNGAGGPFYNANHMQNTYVGHEAGHRGVGNVAMGYFAGHNTSSITEGRVSIGWMAGRFGSGDYNLLLGYRSGQTVFGERNISLGDSTGYNINGDANILLGSRAGKDLDGDNNIFIGEKAGEGFFGNDPKTDNIFIGTESGMHVGTGTENIFLGHHITSFSTSSSGTQSNSILIGNNLQHANLDSNLVIGMGNRKWIEGIFRNSLSTFRLRTDFFSLRSQSDNTNYMYFQPGRAAFVQAGKSIAIGDFETGGDMGGGTNNISMGSEAGKSLSNGTSNVFLGRRAGRNNDGDHNIILGTSAGVFNNGSNNIFLGQGAGSNESGSNRLHIGQQSLIYGEFDNDLLRINGDLDINGPIGGGNIALTFRESGNYRGAWGYDPNQDRFFFYEGASSTNVVFIKNGRLGIRREATTNSLEVNGNASKSTAGDWVGNSDARLKTNIQYPDSMIMLKKVLQMKGATYEWNDDKTGIKRPNGVQYGFIAQDLEKVWPEKVRKDAQGYLETAYGDYDPMFVEAIKALQGQINALGQRISELESENASLKASATSHISKQP